MKIWKPVLFSRWSIHEAHRDNVELFVIFDRWQNIFSIQHNNLNEIKNAK